MLLSQSRSVFILVFIASKAQCIPWKVQNWYFSQLGWKKCYACSMCFLRCCSLGWVVSDQRPNLFHSSHFQLQLHWKFGIVLVLTKGTGKSQNHTWTWKIGWNSYFYSQNSAHNTSSEVFIFPLIECRLMPFEIQSHSYWQAHQPF